VENNKDCAEVECFPSAMPSQDLARHISGPRNKRRSPAENCLKKIGRNDTVAVRRFRLV